MIVLCDTARALTLNESGRSWFQPGVMNKSITILPESLILK